MNVPTKLGVYALGLVAAFGAAAGVGNAVGPIGSTGVETEHGAAHGGTDDVSADESDATGHDAAAGAPTGGHAGLGSGAGEGAEEVPGGLMVSQQGYTLRLARAALPADAAAPLAFQILGTDGTPVTSYEESHDEDLHLIAVRRDTTGFQHVHPELAADGTWSVPLDLTAGDWRVFTDFVPAQGDMAGSALTLGADLAVAGDYQPAALPAPSATAEVDGYSITLHGELVPGEESELTLSVSRDGQPVTDLQPYLAAYGHLVALRGGDLAYLHVHPAGEPGDGVTEPGPDITFWATTPSAGDYRLFLDFRHDGVVRTAEFTARADGAVPEENR